MVPSKNIQKKPEHKFFRGPQLLRWRLSAYFKVLHFTHNLLIYWEGSHYNAIFRNLTCQLSLTFFQGKIERTDKKIAW